MVPGVAIAASHERAKLLEPAMDERLQHAVFASKEVIQGGLGDAGGFADFADRRRVVALHGKEIEGRAEDPLRRGRRLHIDGFRHAPCALPVDNTTVIIPTGKYTVN